MNMYKTSNRKETPKNRNKNRNKTPKNRNKPLRIGTEPLRLRFRNKTFKTTDSLKPPKGKLRNKTSKNRNKPPMNRYKTSKNRKKPPKNRNQNL